MKQSFLIIIFVLAFSTSAFAQAPAGASADPVAGKTKFDMFCATCHGPAGLGDGAAAATLTPKPRNLQATTQTDDQLKKIITEGVAALSGFSKGKTVYVMVTEAHVFKV